MDKKTLIIGAVIALFLVVVLVFSFKISILKKEKYNFPLSPTKCTDSDGGKNYNVRGTADYNYRNYTDFCLNNSRLLEYYCATNTFLYGYSTSVRSVNYTCQYGCSNGACKAANYTCTDSDGGKLPNINGTTIEYLDGKINKQATDNCTSITAVMENYCGTNNRSASSLMTCSAGRKCTSGACLPTSYCTDSDNGINLGVKGTAKQYTNGTLTKTSTDSCNGTIKVNEYYCSGAIIALSVSSCSNGTSRSNGACITSNQTNITTGNLYVTSTPSSANTYVDSIYRGLTPITVYNLAVGNHLVKLNKTGYTDYIANPYIYAGNTTTLSVVLNQSCSDICSKVLKVMSVINSSSSVYSDDKVTLKDMKTELFYDATILSEGNGIIYIGPTPYNVSYYGASNIAEDERYIKLTSPSGTQWKVFRGVYISM